MAILTKSWRLLCIFYVPNSASHSSPVGGENSVKHNPRLADDLIGHLNYIVIWQKLRPHWFSSELRNIMDEWMQENVNIVHWSLAIIIK